MASANEKLFLQAILVEFRRTGLEETTLQQVRNSSCNFDFKILAPGLCTASRYLQHKE